MDVILFPEGERVWRLETLLGQTIGEVKQHADSEFRVHYADPLSAPDETIGRYGTIGEACASIAAHIRGICTVSRAAKPLPDRINPPSAEAKVVQMRSHKRR